jgi:hypothetical protein
MRDLTEQHDFQPAPAQARRQGLQFPGDQNNYQSKK